MNQSIHPDRRRFLLAGTSVLGTLAAGELVATSSAIASPATGGVGYFARFGVTERLLRRALIAALSTGGDFADLFCQHRRTHSLGLEHGAISRGSTTVALGLGVRVLQGDATGYAFTEDFSPRAVEAAARTAGAIARGAGHAPLTRFAPVRLAPTRYPELTPWDTVGVAQKSALLHTLEAKALAANPAFKEATIALWDYEEVMLLATSDGHLVEDRQPLTHLFLTLTAERHGKRVHNTVNLAGRAGLEWWTGKRLDELVQHGVACTLPLLDAVAAPSGELPVVLGAGDAGILLHEAVGHGLEGDFNRTGVSAYASMMGERVAPRSVTIVDDGTRPGSTGALNVDDEGTPAGATTLIEDGVLRSYLHDRISARHYGVAPTGSGRRQGYENAPLPRMRCTYMRPGPHKRDEVIASVKRGIYCDHFGNGIVTLGAGDFSFFVPNGYLIENGRLTRPLRDFNLVGNGPQVLRSLDLVADDLVIDDAAWLCGKFDQRVPVAFGIPTVRIPALMVGGGVRT